MQIVNLLLEKISAKQQKIDEFFATKFAENSPIFYNSFDLRCSNFKISSIDPNCFPAGFNNLSAISKQKAKKVFAEFIKKNFPGKKNILIVAESHTRNLRYLENILALQEIISDSCLVKIGNVEIAESLSIEVLSQEKIMLEPLKKIDGEIFAGQNFKADLILLNNDLSNGLPEILQNLHAPIIPSTKLGWYNRTKSHHFDIYNQLAVELAQILEIDPWLISSWHKKCDHIDFKHQKGLSCVAKKVDELIAELAKKYHPGNIIFLIY